MAANTTLGKLYWAIALLGGSMLMLLRFTLDYTADMPLGILLGVCTLSFAILMVLDGNLRKGGSRLNRFARQVHTPLGVFTLFLAIAHWHFRGRDYLGLATAALLLIMVISLSRPAFRKLKLLRRFHKYGAYTFLILALTHGIRAVFFAPN